MRRIGTSWIYALAVFIAAVIACSDDTSGTDRCGGCPPGAVCTGGDCLFLCNTTVECEADEACIAGVCQGYAETCLYGEICVEGWFCDGLNCQRGNGACPSDVTLVCGLDAECRVTASGPACRCIAGYTGDGTTCIDVNECSLGLHECEPSAACVNIDGSYDCECPTGFRSNGFGCADVDECAEGTHACVAPTECVNHAGSYACDCVGASCQCPPGFELVGPVCIDVDECNKGTDTCSADATCQNVAGSFFCLCNEGFTGGGTICTDIDECTGLTHDCNANASCTNTVGSFGCICFGGYTGDGVTCTDVDECALGVDTCIPPTACANNQGGFDCVSAGWKEVVLGRFAACGVAWDSSLWCWGEDSDGNLGLGTTNSTEPIPLRVGMDNDWQRVSMGYQHTCGIREPGSAWCWGRGVDGEIGDGLKTSSPTPVQVGSMTDWTAITVGKRGFSCGIRAPGSLWCWGNNNDGALGTDGGNAVEPEPIQVELNIDWLEISAGDKFVCGIRAPGNLWCWGDNSKGQIGNGSSNRGPYRIPERVGIRDDWASVDAGNNHTCALTQAGELYCWGANRNGQVGDGTNVDPIIVPFHTGPARTWWRVSAGSRLTCAIDTGDAMFCWGRDNDGQVGNDVDLIDVNIPARVGTAVDWIHVATGSNVSAGLRPGGALFQWGASLDGARTATPVPINGPMP